MRNFLFITIAIIFVLGGAYAIGLLPKTVTNKTFQSLHLAVNPGQLSAAHMKLENDCQACHTPFKGIETTKCILCHANNESILKRQPTAFHASINTCKQCHLEHQGRNFNLSQMEHSLLAHIGMKAMSKAKPGSEEIFAYLKNIDRLRTGVTAHPRISSTESILNCSSCHSNNDQHQSYFGADCAQCHSTDRWTIAEYKHPSPKSNDCSQCHQAPPSHYMMHFKMISAKVAGKPHARVDQCNQCHQTTSWNDIKRVGWYKHH